MKAGLEAQWNFSRAQLAMADGQQLVQKFESVHIHLADQRQAAFQVEGEKPTHVIGEMPVAVRQGATGQMVGQGGAVRASVAEAMDG